MRFTMQKKVCIAFLGNALHDSRIVNLTNSLKNDGSSVKVISFDWFISNQPFNDDTYTVNKLKKGSLSILFYLRFAIILLRELIKCRADLFFAEDFYTLPIVTIVGKFKRAKIFYNSRELYAFLGGLRNRPFLQSIVKSIEKLFIKRVELVLTTGEMDSRFLENFYGINNTLVIRNIPLLQQPEKVIDFRAKYSLNKDTFILIYQGVLLEGRGIPLIIKALEKLPGTVLIILGDGEQKNNFSNQAVKANISDRVFFAGTVSQKELINFTAGGDLGLSLIENISVSYYHALPNKMFEYIMAGVPVLASDLPQMKMIIEKYQVGEAINISNPESIVDAVLKLKSDTELLKKYKTNCLTASRELNWQEEYNRVRNKILD